MAVSTKNVPDAPISNFTGPILSPGNHKVKISSIELRPESDIVRFGEKLMLALETEPVNGPFKGLQIDRNDASKGNYAGQIGFVAYDKWGFKNSTFNNVEIFRDDQVMSAIKNICRELNLMEWFDNADGKFETVNDFVIGFNAQAPFKNVYFTCCIAGREYKSKDGKHLNHELYFPREDRTLGKAFAINPDKVQKFFTSSHIEPLKESSAPATNSPGPASTTIPPGGPATNTNGNEPTKITPTSQQEADFLSAGKQQEVKSETPNTDAINKDADAKAAPQTEKYPWDL